MDVAGNGTGGVRDGCQRLPDGFTGDMYHELKVLTPCHLPAIPFLEPLVN